MPVTISIQTKRKPSVARNNNTKAFIEGNRHTSKLTVFKICTKGITRAFDKEKYLIKLFNKHYYELSSNITFKYVSSSEEMIENSSNKDKESFRVLTWEELDVNLVVADKLT